MLVRRQMIANKSRLSILGLAAIVSVYLFWTAPTTISPIVPGYFGKQCTSRQSFGNLTDSNFFVFIKTKHGDADILSNLFFYLGLKYGKSFAMNIEQPISWYGLSAGHFDSTFLQSTLTPPGIMSQELDYDAYALDKLLGGTYSDIEIDPKIAVGFLRDPYEVFMSCLLRITQYKRRNSGKDMSMMLEKNLIDYLNSFNIEGNIKEGKVYMGPGNCNNQLAFSLGLNNRLYLGEYNLQKNSAAAEQFADLVERRIPDFLIHEKLAKSMFVLKEKHCLDEDEDFLYLSRLPESFVGIGLGTLSAETKSRLEHFLQYDYAIYNRMSRKFDRTFTSLVKNPTFVDNFQIYRDKMESFNRFCIKGTLSLKKDATKRRAYGLTAAGARNIRCSLLNGSNRLLANIIFQVQESNLTNTVAQIIANEREYKDFLELVSSTLGDEDET